MSSEPFLTAISEGPLGRWFLHRLSAIGQIDPTRIYVEDVRSIFGVSTWVAKAVCESGVRTGALKRRFAYYCGNDSHRVITISDVELTPGSKIECDVCELTGKEPYIFPVEELRREMVYGFE